MELLVKRSTYRDCSGLDTYGQKYVDELASAFMVLKDKDICR